MGVGDGLDDRQSQPYIVSAASGLRAESLEGLKEARELVGRDELGSVGDRESRMCSLGTGCDFDSAAGDVCRIAFENRLVASRSRRSGSPVLAAGSSATKLSISLRS